MDSHRPDRSAGHRRDAARKRPFRPDERRRRPARQAGKVHPIAGRPCDPRQRAAVFHAAPRWSPQHRGSPEVPGPRRAHPRAWLAVEQRPDGRRIRAEGLRADRRAQLCRHVQRNHRARDRDPRTRTQGRGDRAVLHVRCHCACAAMAGDHTDLRRYRSRHPQPRPGRRSAHDHAAHYRHRRRSPLGTRGARRRTREHCPTSTDCA